MLLPLPESIGTWELGAARARAKGAGAGPITRGRRAQAGQWPPRGESSSGRRTARLGRLVRERAEGPRRCSAARGEWTMGARRLGLRGSGSSGAAEGVPGAPGGALEEPRRPTPCSFLALCLLGWAEMQGY